MNRKIYKIIREEIYKVIMELNTDVDVDPKQLEVGIKVEKEHTNDIKIAKKIAMDHLSENPSYYSDLISSELVDEPEALELADKIGLKNRDLFKRR